jgi:uncharacterized protein (TIGR02246 family)
MDPVRIVQAQVDAFNARDLEGFVHSYSPDALIEDGLGNTMARGHDAIRTLYGQLFAQSPDLHVEIPQRIHVGSYVLDEEAVTGFVFAGFPTEMRADAVYRVDGNTIVHSRLLM